MSVADFPYLTPGDKLITILNSPRVIPNKNLFSIFDAFHPEVLISITISFLLVFVINSFKTYNVKLKLFLALDYSMILIGQGLHRY
jgi:hypothetical protein